MNNVKINAALACLTWEIPKCSKDEMNLLSHGYIREKSINVKSMIIPLEIIKLCILYLSYDHEILKNLKALGNHQYIYSDIFIYQSLKFMLTLAWDSENTADRKQWNLQYGLMFVTIPEQKHASVDMNVSIHTIELNSILSNTFIFQFGFHRDEVTTPITIQDIQDLKSLTIKLYIHKFVGYDSYQEVVYLEEAKNDNEHQQIMGLEKFRPSPYIFSWNVTNDVPIFKIEKFLPYQTITSPIFVYNKIKWCIQLDLHDWRKMANLKISISLFMHYQSLQRYMKYARIIE